MIKETCYVKTKWRSYIKNEVYWTIRKTKKY